MSIDWLYYLGLAVLSIIQGPIAIVVGAGVATTGVITPLGVFLAVTVGNLSVDLLWYGIGRLGKLEWVLHFRFSHINMDTVTKLEAVLDRKAPKFIFLAKLSSVFVMPVMIAIGLMRLNWKRWFPSLFGVEVLKNVLLIVLGYYSVISITQFNNWFTLFTIPFIILTIVIPWQLFKRSLNAEKTLPAPDSKSLSDKK